MKWLKNPDYFFHENSLALPPLLKVVTLGLFHRQHLFVSHIVMFYVYKSNLVIITVSNEIPGIRTIKIKSSKYLAQRLFCLTVTDHYCEMTESFIKMCTPKSLLIKEFCRLNFPPVFIRHHGSGLWVQAAQADQHPEWKCKPHSK